MATNYMKLTCPLFSINFCDNHGDKVQMNKDRVTVVHNHLASVMSHCGFRGQCQERLVGTAEARYFYHVYPHLDLEEVPLRWCRRDRGGFSGRPVLSSNSLHGTWRNHFPGNEAEQDS